ncbi:unnamed protein product [Calypogeia fissa]
MAANTALHFESTEAMLDHLTTLPASEIAQIRHIHVKSFPFPLYTHEKRISSTTYDMSETLALFPGLALDLLTVEDPYHDPDVNDGWGDMGTYFDIETLIKSKGWKELHYTSPTTEFMSSLNDPYNSRRPQPEGWDKLLKDRDGENSGAEVKMFVAKESGGKGLAADLQKGMVYEFVPRKPLAEVVHQLPDGPRGAMVTDFDVDNVGIDSREVLLVAKRGTDADYVQDGKAVNERIKALWDKMSWQEIKESGRHIDPGDDPCAHL